MVDLWAGHLLDPPDLVGRRAGSGEVLGVLRSERGVRSAAEYHLQVNRHIGADWRATPADSGQRPLLDLQVTGGFTHGKVQRPQCSIGG